MRTTRPWIAPVPSTPALLTLLLGAGLSAYVALPESSRDAPRHAVRPAALVAIADDEGAQPPALLRAGEREPLPGRPEPDPLRNAPLNCTVIQRGNPTDSLWWFGGADAANYSESVRLVVRKSRVEPTPPLRWQVTRGATKVDFANGKDRIVTNEKSVELFSTAPSASAVEVLRDVTVRVTDALGVSCVHHLVVFAPDHLVFSGQFDFAAPEGFTSQISFRSEDQFSNTLPHLLELNQDFGDEVSDFPGENWVSPPESSGSVNPALWSEITERCGPSFSTPPVQAPQVPLTNVKVDHRSGVIRHGSNTTVVGDDNNPGVAVRGVKWQVYQDHARHELP